MRPKANRIDAMRHDLTGEIGPAHMIGTTRSGKTIYARADGWSPVAEMKDGTYRDSTSYTMDVDYNYVIREPERSHGFFGMRSRPTGI
jgi:hypothetical protein